MSMTTRQRPAKKVKQASKPRKPTNDKWWEQAEEVPRAGLPAAEKLDRRSKRMRRFVWSYIVMAPLMILVLIILMANSLGGSDAPPAPKTNQFAATKSDAVVAVRKWLASSPSPLPGGVLVGWDSATSKKVTGDPEDTSDDYTVEVHHLTVASPTGTLYGTTVSLAVSDVVGAAVVGEPSLVPRPPSDQSFRGESTWPGLDDTQAPEPVEAAVSTWAQAYSSGDPKALGLAIQDTSEAHSYMPLVGARLTEGSVEKAAGLWPKDMTAAQREEAGDPDRMIVRAVFAIRWSGVKVDAEDDLPTVTYDLLVEKADTAAPVVVAWGGPGTGPSLKRYGNAVEGREISAAADDPDEATLSDEPLPGTNGSSTGGAK